MYLSQNSQGSGKETQGALISLDPLRWSGSKPEGSWGTEEPKGRMGLCGRFRGSKFLALRAPGAH